MHRLINAALRHLRGLVPIVATTAVAAAAIPALPARALEAVQIGMFASPVYVSVAPGHPNFVFVVERAGQIRMMRGDITLAEPFLDISDIVRGPPDPDAGGEQGLLSVAFAPDFRTSRLFYVAFTNRRGDIELNEFRTRPRRPMLAARASRRILVRIPHPGATNHNGGQLAFGPDGMLYMSTGDGGNVQPLGENARRLDNLLGKILRIDPRPGPKRAYRIPRDNPLIGRDGRKEIFAYGLRNPWRFAFAGRRLVVADVGQSAREEVNVDALPRASGANYGWPEYEGDIVFDASRPGPDAPTFPHFVYDHAAGGCAIVGGYVVVDRSLPGLRGRYLYGDLCTGEVRSIAMPPRAPDDRATGLTIPQITSFGRGFGGTIYISRISGQVYRLQAD